MPKTEWVGFLLPARLLQPEEIDLLSPLCERCSLKAIVVEAQAPFTDKEAEEQPLIEFMNEELKFYCAYHSPLEIPEEISQSGDLAFHQQLMREVLCPKFEHRRFAGNCLRYKPNCLKRCQPIKALLGNVPLRVAMERMHRAHAILEAKKVKP